MKAPGFGENRKSSLHDLAILTGGAVSISSSLEIVCLVMCFRESVLNDTLFCPII